MVSVTQNYLYNGNLVTVNLNDVPIFSKDVIDYLEGLNFGLPPLLKLPEGFKEKLKNLDSLQKELLIAKDHAIRDRILAIFQIISVVAIVAFGVFIATMGEAGLPFMVVYVIGCVFLSIFFEEILGDLYGKYEKRTQMFPEYKGVSNRLVGSVLGGGALLSHQIFTRSWKLQKAFDELFSDLRQSIQTLEAENQEKFTKAVHFYAQNGEKLLKNLDREAKRAQTAFYSARNRWWQSNFSEEREILKQIQLLRKTRSQVNASKEFFLSFAPPDPTPPSLLTTICNRMWQLFNFS